MIAPLSQDISDPHPLPGRRRRWLWEAHEDTVAISKFLLAANAGLVFVLGMAVIIIFQIHHRSPSILSEDLGYVRYHTSEAYRLTEPRIRAFLESTLVRMLSVLPGYYDISDLDAMVSPEIIAGFSGHNAQKAELRLEQDVRQLFGIYEIRRHFDRRYPDLLNYIVRGERTIYARQPDSNGNLTIVPESEIVFWSVYLRKIAPSPASPWGLQMVGAGALPQATADELWPDAVFLHDDPELQEQK